MKAIEVVKEKYNGGQDGFIINVMYKSISYNDKWRVSINDMNIGFYQWLFAPEYKVFEVFKIKIGYIMSTVGFSANEGDIIKQPEEIIKYLAKEVE